jgi:protein-S-isoprenylcysteine O-methyltransferase Ste14
MTYQGELGIMNIRISFFAAILSTLFTIGVFFLMWDAMRVVNELLLRFFPDSGPQLEEIISSLRPFFYLAFGVTFILMLLGLIIGKRYLSIVGAIVMYLPTFGYFTVTMFPLAGLGLLCALWLPLLDFSPSILRLGDIIYAPYNVLINQLGVRGYIIIETLSSVLMVVGVFIFFLGVLTWIYGKFKGCEIIDFWIYRISRHPQYLGLLLWSYGLTMLTMFRQILWSFIFPEPSLPWLVYALTLVAVALNEEVKMVKKYGEKYMKYRNSVSFMMPLSKTISRLLTFPIKVLLKKNLPENRKEIIYTILIYAAIFISISFLAS